MLFPSYFGWRTSSSVKPVKTSALKPERGKRGVMDIYISGAAPMQVNRNSYIVDNRFSVDTTFVLFFLAVDFGQSAASFGLDSLLSLITLGMLLVLPYFLPSVHEKPEFGTWVAGRAVIAAFAIALGAMFQRSVGLALPEAFRFLPMTFVILTAMLSCYLQFCAIIRFRLAR